MAVKYKTGGIIKPVTGIKIGSRPVKKILYKNSNGDYKLIYPDEAEPPPRPGEVWTLRQSAGDNVWTSVCYGKGLFVAVAGTSTGNHIMTSPDGDIWTRINSPANNDWRSVCYGEVNGKGLFVAVSINGTNRVMTSENGEDWVSRQAAASISWRSVCYGKGIFVAVSSNASASSGVNSRLQIMTSTDGETWVLRNSVVQNQTFYSICYGAGRFVAVGNSFQAITSENGIDWTSRAIIPGDWRSVCFGNGLFVAVSADANAATRTATSPDAANWTARQIPAGRFFSVCYGAGRFVAVGTTEPIAIAVTSETGIDWALSQVPANTDYWLSVCFGDGKFAAVSQLRSGTGNRVMTSP